MMDTILFPCVTQEAFLAEQPKLWSAVFRSDPIVENRGAVECQLLLEPPKKDSKLLYSRGP